MSKYVSVIYGYFSTQPKYFPYINFYVCRNQIRQYYVAGTCLKTVYTYGDKNEVQESDEASFTESEFGEDESTSSRYITQAPYNRNHQRIMKV